MPNIECHTNTGKALSMLLIFPTHLCNGPMQKFFLLSSDIGLRYSFVVGGINGSSYSSQDAVGLYF